MNTPAKIMPQDTMNSTSVKALLAAKDAENATIQKLKDEGKERERIKSEYANRFVNMCVEKLVSDVDFDIKHGITHDKYSISNACGINRIPIKYLDLPSAYRAYEHTPCESFHAVITRAKASIESWREQGGLSVSVEAPADLPKVSKFEMDWITHENKCPNQSIRWFSM